MGLLCTQDLLNFDQILVFCGVPHPFLTILFYFINIHYFIVSDKKIGCSFFVDWKHTLHFIESE